MILLHFIQHKFVHLKRSLEFDCLCDSCFVHLKDSFLCLPLQDSTYYHTLLQWKETWQNSLKILLCKLHLNQIQVLHHSLFYQLENLNLKFLIRIELLESLIISHKGQKVALRTIAQVSVKDANTLMVNLTDEQVIEI